MGVTTAKDKSDINSCGFGISKFSADPSAWQAGNFVITKRVVLLKSPRVYNDGGRGKDILWQGHRGGCGARWMGMASLLLCTLGPLSPNKWWEQQRWQGDGSRVMGAAEVTKWWEQQRWKDSKLQHRCLRMAALQEKAPELHPPLLQHHWDHTPSPLGQRGKGWINLSSPSNPHLRVCCLAKIKPANLLRSNSPKFSNIL